MTYDVVAQRARAGAGWCIALLGLAIPISTALDSLILGALLLAALVALPRGFAEWRRSVASVPPLLAGAILFGALIIGCFYSNVPWRAASAAAFKYAELILIPLLLWAAVSKKTRQRALTLFIAAIVLNLIVSYALANDIVGHIPGLRGTSHYPIGFKMSTTHGLMISLAAFACLLLAREVTTTAARAPLIGLAVLCIHNVLFISWGRTAYVVLAVLLAYFIVSTLRGWRSIAVAALVVMGILSAAYFGSASFSERVQEVARDATRWEPGTADKTSTGQRMGYYRTTLQIIGEHPFTGVGTGGFPQAYAEKVRGTEAPATGNPHNEYLMIGAQLGIPGIVLLLLLYGSIWFTAPRLGSRLERDLARGLAVAMAINSLFNSVLMDHTEGMLFAWAVALLYAGYLTDRKATATTQTA